MKIKTAKTEVAAVYVDCPACGEGLENPQTGSHMWVTNDPVPQTHIECGCGATVKLPKMLVRQVN